MPNQKPLRIEPIIPAPRDEAYGPPITLHVDATDVGRGIFKVRQTVPTPQAGLMTLLYPKWLPGFHAPAAAIELFAGLEIFAGDLRLAWRRDAVEVHAFHIEVPHGSSSLEARFQFLSPTAPAQGAIAVTEAISAVRWGAMVLYPAGYYARRIDIDPRLRLPQGWTASCALSFDVRADGELVFPITPLDDLIDSPVLAGRWTRRAQLDEEGTIHLALAADRPDLLNATDEQLKPHRNLIAEADALFGVRPFERYEFLVALSEELGGGGVEHHRSCEIVAPPSYFTDWESNAPKRDVFAHEFVHAWNGKGRRGADSRTDSFEQPIRNSLMWVYEGLTQYWGEVLATRCGFWTPQQARDTLARTAAVYDNRPGGAWRPMSDTTRDPIIAGREPLPWPSWQRSEDYYAEGQLLWLEVDTLIRELSGEARSLDDFARAFFGAVDGYKATSTYEFHDVVAALETIAAYDWVGLFDERLERREIGAPLGGLERGGYRLVYRHSPSDFTAQTDRLAGLTNLRFSIGLVVQDDGTLQEVIWDSPAFKAGAVAGAKVRAVNGEAFRPNLLQQAVAQAESTGEIELVVERGGRVKTLAVAYDQGLKFPHLEAIEGAPARLDDIYRPRRQPSSGDAT